ncbi:MAG: ABC transporter ATP-binding protein [Planctomycetota bacterium]|nr:ABC transporter ATP-binding protein [Planctomycetota bacterium]
MKPGDTLQRGFQDWKVITGKHGDLIRAQSSLLVGSASALSVEVMFALLAPWPVKYIFDGLLIPRADTKLLFVPPGWPQEHTLEFLGIVSAAVLIISMGQGVFGYLRTVMSAMAGQRMIMKLRKRVYSHLIHLSLRFHRDQKLGDLLVRITGDVPMLRDVLSTEMVDFSGRVIQAIATLSLMAWIDPALTVISLVVLLIVSLLSRVFSRRITKVARKQRQFEGDIAFTTGESLSSLQLIKSLGREKEMVRRFARKNRSSLRQGVRSTRLQASLSRWIELVFAGGLSVVLLAGAWRVLGNSGMTPGDLLVFVSYVRSLQKPLRRASRLAAKVGKGAACAERIAQVLEIEPEEQDLPDAVEAPPLSGRIEFKDLHFRYQLNGSAESEQYLPPALQGVQLEIPAGQHLVITGPNGAGKSTLFSLLLRLYEPNQGEILIDGQNVTRWTIQSLRDQISVVLQESLVLFGTVRDNLLFHRPDATDEQMIAALEAAGCQFLLKHPDQLDRDLAEGAEDLSGGERRKFSLAAAMLRNAPVVILDEPTTGIDQSSREEIRKILPRFMEGKTLLIVTHDEELAVSFDRKITMKDGRIVQSPGTDQGSDRS